MSEKRKKSKVNKTLLIQNGQLNEFFILLILSKDKFEST